MPAELSRARESVQRASDTADESLVRERLDSVDEALLELGGGDKTRRTPPHGDRLEEVEEKIVDLMDETEGTTRTRLADARDALDAYRRKYEEDL